MTDFSPVKHWRAVVLYGRNTATYKMGLAQVLLQLADEGEEVEAE